MASNFVTEISSNIYFHEDERFGDFDRKSVFTLIRSVDLEFSKALGLVPFSTCLCHIKYHSEYPMCCKSLNNSHVIYLSPNDPYGGQWLYQFAHEFCHHLINGSLSGEITGLTWFEETVCTLASVYHISTMNQKLHLLSGITNPHLCQDLPVRLDGLLKFDQLVGQRPLVTVLQSWDNLLKEEQYHRNLYKAIAAKMFPLFRENPNLWKIILHFGNMKERDSLTDLFQDLSKFVDSSYSDSFQKLQNLLIS